MQATAQTESTANLPQFLYPEFIKCIVKMKSGESHTALMNYNTVTGKMVFYQSGVLMELNKPETVDTIFLQNAKFVFHEKAFCEVLVNAPISLFIQHKSDLSSSEKPSAYGAASQTSASTSVSKIYNDKAYNLKLPENFKVIPSPVYWVKMNNVMYKIETFIPEDHIIELREKLNSIGALTIDGIYDNCLTTTKVTSYWRPLKGANPFLGKVGELAMEEELKVEFCCQGTMMQIAVDAIKEIHPYEKPVIIVIPIMGI